jgi:hypothetical protein
MTLCPIAIAVGCMKCPVFRICPLKGIIGDYRGNKEPRESPARGSRAEEPRESKAGKAERGPRVNKPGKAKGGAPQKKKGAKAKGGSKPKG